MSFSGFKFSTCLTLLVGLALGVPGFAAPEPRVLHVRADSWMPFNGDPESDKPGYVIELLRGIFEPQGIKVDYQVMPWADSLKAAAAGEIDGVIGANPSEAGKLFIGKESIAEPHFSLFVRKGNPWQYQNLVSLQAVRLGAVEGYSYWESIDGFIRKNSASTVKLYSGNTPATDAINDLAEGKIDVFVESVLVFYWTVKSSGHKSSDYRSAYTESTEPLYVAFAKSKLGLFYANKLDEGLREFKTSGRYASILEKYGVTGK